MKTLLMFEKKSQKETFMKINNFIEIVGTTTPSIIITKMLTDYKFKYPQEKYNKYPIIQNIDYKDINSYPELDHDYDRLVIATDFDYVGHFSVHKILINKIGDNWRDCFDKIIVINTNSYDSEETRTMNLDLNYNLSFFEKNINYAERKYYFDYNYNLNSKVFFNEIIKKKNLSKLNISISKYMLLALWQIRNKKLMSLGIYDFMHNYKGSGKYEKRRLGSVASIGTIIKNLEDLGFLDNSGITANGNSFLDSLVKQAFDPDLPMRIDIFSNNPDPDVFNKIDKYLLNVFSKQKNKNKGL